MTAEKANAEFVHAQGHWYRSVAVGVLLGALRVRARTRLLLCTNGVLSASQPL